MIPSTMNFWWSAHTPMSWLRAQTITSFQRHNPNWTTVAHLPVNAMCRGAVTEQFLAAGVDYVGLDYYAYDPLIPYDTRCDMFRWRRLSTSPGWFSDLDIIYLRPMPQVTEDVKIAITNDGGTDGQFALGVIGVDVALGVNIEDLYERASQDVRRQLAVTQQILPDHQIMGTRALVKHAADVGLLPADKSATYVLPAAQLYPVGFLSKDVNELWNPAFDHAGIPWDDLLGLHWGGGHVNPRQYENAVTLAWAREFPTVPISYALLRNSEPVG